MMAKKNNDENQAERSPPSREKRLNDVVIHSVKAGLIYGSVGLVVSSLLSLAAFKYSATYQRLRLPGRVFFVTSKCVF